LLLISIGKTSRNCYQKGEKLKLKGQVKKLSGTDPKYVGRRPDLLKKI